MQQLIMKFINNKRQANKNEGFEVSVTGLTSKTITISIKLEMLQKSLGSKSI